MTRAAALLSGAAAAVLAASAALAPPARAQWTVTNPSQEMQDLMNHVSTMLRWVDQANGMRNHLTQLRQVAGSVNGVRDLGFAARTAFGELRGGEYSTIGRAQSLLNGQGQHPGAARWSVANAIAGPQGSGPQANYLQSQINALANWQAETFASIEAAESSIRQFEYLARAAQGQPTLQHAATLRNALAASQGALQQANYRTQRLEALRREQAEVERLREQARAHNANHQIAQATAAAWSRPW
jgi:hypothetical protein